MTSNSLLNAHSRIGDTVLFRTRAVERDAPVMDGGSIDLV
jgi:hypothetical protein